ncbi:hypothetical protein DPMN_112996, partial [Dreissena polymorpha]
MVVNLSDKANEEKAKEEEALKVDVHENNQKLGLVEALLSIGAWDQSKCMLDWLPEFFATTHKPVAAALCVMIHTAMEPAYRKYSGLTTKLASKWKKPDEMGCAVPRASTYKELNTLVFPMVTYLGPYIACDPVLLVKLIRLGKEYMNKRKQSTMSVDDNSLYFGLLNILDEVLLPSLSFLSCNCCVSEELWGLVKMFPYELRYRVYGNWKNELYNSHPQLIKVKADCLEKSKYIMKRLAKENVKISGRQLGKLSHSNPGVLFEYIIRQIEKYDNLIGPVVDALKYLTNLSYDMLIFCIIEAVAGPEKEKTKLGETSLAGWLQSLANFAGSICKKYQVELSGLMQYVTNQLKAGKSIDLLLMREIVQKMAGIEISEEITKDQLDAMSGGELLRQEGGYFTQVRNTKKSSSRLKDTVLEHDLALSLCLLISQHRDAVIYKEGARHLKHFGKLYDQIQKYIEASELVMTPVVENVRPLQSPKIWEDLSPTFYVTFWALSMYDIHVPNAAYEKQISHLQAQALSVDDNKDMPQSKRKKEKERCSQLIDKLKEEEKRQTEHVQRVNARLKAQREQWFVSRATKNETITQFLQLCIFPRCCFTASDAVYCAEFIHILHSLKTPNFSTLICYDRIFCDITYTVSSCTENEAQRYGRFLCAALETVMRWHSNKEFYDKECGTYPGFVTVFRKGENSNTKADQLDFENYRHVCHKWHFRITKAMVACIESGNYIQIRNALIILTKILPHYPRILQFGSPLERRVDRLKQEEKEKRPDLFALAMGYSGQLKAKKSTWVPEHEFHVRDKEKKQGAGSSQSVSAQSSLEPVGGKIEALNGKDKPAKLLNGDKNGPVKDKDMKRTKLTEKTVEKSKSEEKVKVTAGAESRAGTESKKSASETDRREEATAGQDLDRVKVDAKSDKKDDKTNKKDDKVVVKEKISKSKDDRVDGKVKVKKEQDTKDDSRNIVTPLKLKVKVKEEKVEEPEGPKIERMEKRGKSKERVSEGQVRGKGDREGDSHDGKVKSKEIKEKEEELQARLERIKNEKSREKEARREKQERKKRSHSPEEAAAGGSAGSRDQEEPDWEPANTTTITTGHHNRHTPDVSPRHPDERDSKRRKTDVGASGSKEDTGLMPKSRHRHSASPERDRDRERKEKKRRKEAKATFNDADSSHSNSFDYEERTDNDAAVYQPKKRRSLETP